MIKKTLLVTAKILHVILLFGLQMNRFDCNFKSSACGGLPYFVGPLGWTSKIPTLALEPFQDSEFTGLGPEWLNAN